MKNLKILNEWTGFIYIIHNLTDLEYLRILKDSTEGKLLIISKYLSDNGYTNRTLEFHPSNLNFMELEDIKTKYNLDFNNVFWMWDSVEIAIPRHTSKSELNDKAKEFLCKNPI